MSSAISHWLFTLAKLLNLQVSEESQTIVERVGDGSDALVARAKNKPSYESKGWESWDVGKWAVLTRPSASAQATGGRLEATKPAADAAS